MKSRLIVVAVFLLLAFATEFCDSKTTRRVNPLLSRKKRYLAFPTGSNFVDLLLIESFRPHIEELATRCKKALNIIKCMTNWGSEREILLRPASDLLPKPLEQARIKVSAANREYRHYAIVSRYEVAMTLSMIKSVMVTSPPGINMVGEIDVPFSLPSDSRFFRFDKAHQRREKRQIFNQIITALDGSGLDGQACVKRMLCDVEKYILQKERSLVNDLLSVLFRDDGHLEEEYTNYCHNSTYVNCNIPIIDILTNLQTIN